MTARPDRTTVLLVEDEEAVRALIAHVLRAAGYDLIEAVTGEQAVALAREHTAPIGLVLADLNLHGEIDGRAAVTAVTAAHPEARTLFVSGESEGAAPGAYLGKPFSPARLVERVREVLAN